MDIKNTRWFKVGRTLLKTFVSTILAQLIVFGSGILNLTMTEWKVVFAAGLAAVIVAAYNALNPSYKDYGIGSTTEQEVE